ncbi:winged helix-turn-helix transcriptional regulator [Jiangella alkaliphila]|uniref:Sugar-specific transcriptional regulator TrmB n=1 Tax=Jiangella alkaliphila TaxID=419479 RepID=A0A1H2INS2_9ACTN|nr:winged helix-turn-helix transcriptional regulator [Jiangella alkaliphila]SDU45605.1 Sugar-specific transcriptional regulator TrmB [Jiangella alkaliphila]
MLQALGVTAQDEELYRTLLRFPRSTLEDLADAGGHATSTVRRSVRRLEQLGLVTRLAGAPVRFVPARPDVAVDVLVAQRQRELALAREAAHGLLQEMTVEHVQESGDLIEIVRGRQAVAHRFMQMEQTVAHELLVLDRPPYAQALDQPNDSEYDLLARGVRCRGIYAPEGLERRGRLDELRRLVDAGEEARTSPVVPLKMAIADASVAILPLSFERSAEQALVVHASTLVDALVSLFEVLWDLALPITGFEAAQPQTAGEVDPAVSALLPLLVAGLGDQAIARQLGVSSRTLSRQLATLMETLGARTRFQAGVLAVVRGLAGPDSV